MPVSHALFASLFNQHVKCRANSGRIESQEDGVVKKCFLNVTYALAYDGSRSVATITSAADTEGKILKLHQSQHRICVNLTAPFNAIHCIRDCITQNGDNGCQNSYHQRGIYHQYQLRISSVSSTCHTLRLGKHKDTKNRRPRHGLHGGSGELAGVVLHGAERTPGGLVGFVYLGSERPVVPAQFPAS